MKYRVLIIGLGHIGLGYDINTDSHEVKTHTKAFFLNKNFEIVGGVDPSCQARDIFEIRTKKNSYSSLEEIYVSDRELDVIVIATPTRLRLGIFQDLCRLRYTSNIILLEKPIATTVSEGIAVKELAFKIGRSLYVNYIRRCDPILKRVKENINNNVYGKLLEASCNYYGSVLNIASHYIDLCQYLLNESLTMDTVSKRMIKEEDFLAEFVLLTSSRKNISFLNNENNDITLELSFEKAKVEILNNGNVVKTQYNSGVEEIERTMLYEYQRNVVKEIELKLMNGTNVSLNSGEEVVKLCEEVRLFKI